MTIAAGIELPEGAIADICRRYQVKELSLFGSAARGEMRPDSDLDLLVDFLPGARPGLLGVSAMMRELTALLGRRVDLAVKPALKPLLRVERGAVRSVRGLLAHSATPGVGSPAATRIKRRTYSAALTSMTTASDCNASSSSMVMRILNVRLLPA